MPKRGQKLFIRQAVPEDIPAIIALTAKVYAEMGPYSKDELRGQLNHYPPGHMVAIYEDQIVGYSASLRVSEASARPTTPTVTGSMPTRCALIRTIADYALAIGSMRRAASSASTRC